jgi:ATP-dependent Lon protease
LIGEPGVGKTAFAMSIAKALNRKFEVLSLTKFPTLVADAKYGKHSPLVTALINCKSMNPVILLDEIDKVED